MYRNTTNVEHEYVIMSVKIAATGIVTKAVKTNLKVIPEKNSIDPLEIQLYLEHCV
jgi:hypothetical protein